jgi:hypothetical protein
MGMNWNLSIRNGHTRISHEGGTGGYSSFAAFDRAGKRAVVLLSDTALTSVAALDRSDRTCSILPVASARRGSSRRPTPN